ncbi:hypothetical protein KC332_g3516 [Hortaea werneckii]|uniref:Mediator of RNA polymerase II transcription subunit 6 n=1 Tax=Hortaea werneckii TaxID=91943 RepID=A0A3M7J7W4_HORWE|nr:hypothetical protein KC358_g7415 [Hortaea werneckii]KAI6929685.1 hypothetical protein KC348_g7782 [Hortaea werneckii]KAI6940547.1 hypothetical protein KC341_g3449 [Hortaea werneckii]KAI6996210.1 hypothetical protein KC329_g2125 [Hortaea werneckii]KAI7043936.1 hypothetical protein KC362_g3659 [Hortaea werneckii]
MARPADPLDEQVSRRPDVLDWWMNHADPGLGFPRYPMEERLIHRYFSETPFFDWQTKEGLAITQAGNDWENFRRVHTRQEFEEILAKRAGTEYHVDGELVPIPGAPAMCKMSKNGVWVVRKIDRPESQERSNNPQNPFPETEVLGTYYIVGENVYMAPSIGDVVGNRLLSAATSLSTFFDKAKTLPSFSPTTGYSYLPQTQQKSSGAASGTQSPSQSREGSVAPGADPMSLRAGSVAPESQADGTKTSSSAHDSRLLAQSLQMAIQFGEEYTDENPLLGEPGAFKFTSSTAAVKKRKADEEAAAQKAREAKAAAAASASNSPAGSPKLEAEKAAPTPPAVFTDAKASATEKVKKEERRKRKRSKATLTSPNTPVSGNTPAPSSSGG